MAKAQASESTLKVGQRVRVLVNSPTGEPVDGTVRVIQDKPGKQVGVELDNYAETAHTLDGELSASEKVEESTGRRYGKGWWTLPDYLEVL